MAPDLSLSTPPPQTISRWMSPPRKPSLEEFWLPALEGACDVSFGDHSPTDPHPYHPGNSVQLAFSPDSGYGHTPDGIRHHPDQQRLAQPATTCALALPGSGSSRSNSERTSSSDSVGATSARETAGGESSALFCGGDMSLPRRARFGIGEAVTAVFPIVVSPPSSSVRPQVDSETSGDEQQPLDSLSPSSVTLTAGRAGDRRGSRITGRLPEKARSSSSSSPTLPPSPWTHGVSTPSLSSLPTSPRHNTHTPDRPRPPRYRSRDEESERRERSRQIRSRSQPMVASLTMNKPVGDPRRDSSSGAGQKDYFQVTDELSRENSHFSLSEALLTVVEQYKANTTEAMQETIRGERSQATPTADYLGTAPGSSELYATSPPPRSWGSLSSIATEDSVGEFSLQKTTPKISLLELMRASGGSVQSAESTAQRLLQFIATQYSGVDSEDMDYSTSTVLTLPVDFLCSLRQDDDLQRSVTTSSLPTRGSKDWAPPRAQIIFHVKTPPRSVTKCLAAQGYRCTGCGMRQDPSQARHFRFCHYTGRYFCPRCHANATSIIPAHILHHWSFKKYCVSNFAHDLLERIHYDPVFDVHYVNPKMYSTTPILAQARDLRTQLVAVKTYLKTCRQAQSLMATFDGYIPWTADVHTYSIDDFLQVKLKIRYLRSLLQDSVKHVKSCPLCQGKGFVCEFCNSPEIIFPFELTKVAKCPHCQCCFHKQCFNTQPCPRCIRMRQRERRRRAQCVEDHQQPAETTSSC